MAEQRQSAPEPGTESGSSLNEGRLSASLAGARTVPLAPALPPADDPGSGTLDLPPAAGGETLDVPPPPPTGGETLDIPAAPLPEAPAGDMTLDVPAAAPAGSETLDVPAAGVPDSIAPGSETLDVPAEPAPNSVAPGGATCGYTPTGATGGPAQAAGTNVDGPFATGGPGARAATRAGPGGSTLGSAPAAGRGGAPKQINRYVLQKFHARGGMGEVWLAQDSDIGRQVALKRMRKQVRDQKDAFLWEAQVTGQLEHPGVIPVHELSRDDKGEPYYIMKFVHGQTLLKAIDDFHAATELDPSAREVQRLRLLQVFLTLCQTVAYAHSRGVIHRDIKPENVMIGEYGETLVLDWGLAKIVGHPERPSAAGPVQRTLSGESSATMAGAIKGTPSYMAPEMATGDVNAVDHQSDVFLLGGTLYHMLTGKRPRQATSVTEYIVLTQKPTLPARKLDARIPRPLEAICAKALAVAKEDRYQTATALADDMQRYLAGEPVSAYRETFLERAARWCRRHRQALMRTAAGLAVAALVVFGVAKYRDLERLRQEEQEQHALELKQQEERRAEAERVAEDLRVQKQAQQDLAAFHTLAEEMRFFVASTNPVAAQAPFFDPRAGLAKGEEALALAAPWGPKLEAFPLSAERPALASDLHDLLLLMAQVRGDQAPGPEGGKQMLALLDRAALLAAPTRSDYRLRAQALQHLGQVEAAAVETKKAEDPKTPLTAMDHFLLGETYRVPLTRPEELQDHDGKFRPNPVALERAAEQYRLALRLDPNHYWSHFQLARCLMSMGRGPEAVQTYSTCIALRPDSPWGHSVRGLALTMLKRYNEAEADLNRAVELAPASRAVRLNRGVLAWKRQDLDEALAHFDAVLAPPADQRLLEAAFYKAQIFGEIGKGDVLAEVNLALSAEHPSRTMYLFRAQLYFLLGQDQKCLADLDSFLTGGQADYDPKSAAASGQRGHRLRLLAEGLEGPQAKQRGRMLRLAEKELKDSAQRGVQSAAVFQDLGAVQEQLGRSVEAIAAYTRALEIEPKSTKLLVLRGWAYEKLQPPALEKAQADFDAATRIEPENAEAHSGLGYMQACRKSEVGARREAQRAVLYGAGDFLILHNSACVYAKLSEVEPKRAAEFEDLALDHLRRAVELWKRDRTGPNEIELIRQDPAFTRSLRARPEFQQLLDMP
jgi:tetratricopeptide (TPR) repeat protein